MRRVTVVFSVLSVVLLTVVGCSHSSESENGGMKSESQQRELQRVYAALDKRGFLKDFKVLEFAEDTCLDYSKVKDVARETNWTLTFAKRRSGVDNKTSLETFVSTMNSLKYRKSETPPHAKGDEVYVYSQGEIDFHFKSFGGKNIDVSGGGPCTKNDAGHKMQVNAKDPNAKIKGYRVSPLYKGEEAPGDTESVSGTPSMSANEGG